MNAVISGQVGAAVFLEGGDVFSFHADYPEEVYRRSHRDLLYLLEGGEDLQFLENVDIEEVGRRVDLATSQMDSLRLLLILLDSELSDDAREAAAEELEINLDRLEVETFVEEILCARPLPVGADLKGALSICTGFATSVGRLLRRLGDLQATIAKVSLAWKQIPTWFFESERHRAHALAVAVREGFFRELVLSCFRRDPIELFHFKALGGTGFRRIENYEGILDEWLFALQKEMRVPHLERLNTSLGNRLDFLTFAMKDELGNLLRIGGKRVRLHSLGDLLGIDIPKALAILAILGCEGVCQNSLLIFHHCDSITPVDSIPFGVGYPGLPWICKSCGETVRSLSDLSFELEAVIIYPVG